MGRNVENTDSSSNPDANQNASSSEGSESTEHAESSGSVKDRIPAEEVDTEALEIVREESREVLNEQLSLLSDIDDKAMRTVRTSVLFIGLVISAIQLSGTPIAVEEIGRWPFRLATAGVTFLLASIVAGIWTYSVSDPDFGVSSDHRKDIVAGGYTEREWLLLQLNEYDEWTDSMRDTNETNVVGLHATLFSLIAGVLSLLLSAVLTMGISFGDFIYPIAFTILIVLGITTVLWVARRDT